MIITGIYLASLVLLTIFSFTQIDIRSPFYTGSIFEEFNLGFQVQTQEQRMLIGTVFTLIFLFLIFGYFVFINNHKMFIARGRLIKILSIIMAITFIAYPAVFSADFYSYIFYSKILIYYRQLPWIVAPSDFPFDELYQSIHWKGDSSRYGPIWIGFSSIPYFLSFGNLFLALWNLKLAFYAIYFATLIVLCKIANILKKNEELVFITFITNPLILIEYLVNPHTDVLMNLFALIFIYSILRGEYTKGFAAWILSISTKIVTAPLILGLFAYKINYLKKSPERVVKFFLMLSLIGSAVISYRWSLNPWYLSLPIVIMTLLVNIKFYRHLMITLSSAAVVRYLPLIFLGYFPPDNKIRRDLFLILLVPFLLWFLYRFIKHLKGGRISAPEIIDFLKSENVI